MMNKQTVLLTLSFILVFLSGTFFGSRIEIVNRRIVLREETKILKDKKINLVLKNPQAKSKSKKTENVIETKKDESSPSDCYYYETDFDRESIKERYQALDEKWKQTLNDFFRERSLEPEKLQLAYEKLKEERSKAHHELYEKNMANTKISENSYAFIPSWENDQKRFDIDRRYHEKVKKLLGEKSYQQLQNKIKAAYLEQIKYSRETGEPFVGNFE